MAIMLWIVVRWDSKPEGCGEVYNIGANIHQGYLIGSTHGG